MIGRLGVTGRLLAIFILALLTLMALSAAAFYLERMRATGGMARAPLPDEIAAIVELLEHAGEADRQTVLRAVNSANLRVTIADETPTPPAGAESVPAVERMLARNIPQSAGRQIHAYLLPLAGGRVRPARQWIYSDAPLRIDVSLVPSGTLVAETEGELSRRVFGLPPGFSLGIIGFLVAVLSSVALMREMRPILAMQKALERFSTTAEPQPVKVTGAREIRALATTVNAMQRRLADLVRGRAVMLAAISHDLKTYVTRLRLRAEMLSDPADRAKTIADLDLMTALIDDTVGFARAATVSDRRERANLASLIAEEIKAREPAPLEVAGDLAGTRVFLDADPVALRRLFGNLLDNALRYGTKARIGLSMEEADAIVRIDDDGPGIPVAERSLVFEPFYRVENSRSRQTGGSGLGLAIAQQIAAAHSGRILIEDSPLGGARLTVRLPSR